MPSVMSFPGINAPGGTKTPFMPARAFGAPHTTCTGSPLPLSTMHTRSRSALGCCSAETTRAMEKGASNLPRSKTFSTSSPIIVSLSTTAASGASLSRCSLSQASVNFISSPAQPSRERRKIERAKPVMRQPAHVGFEERAQIGHPVFEHGDTIDPHAPGETLILVRIEPAVAQDVGMHHAAAENLHPILAFAESKLALFAPALDIGLERRLREGKERGAKAHLQLINLEEGLAEFLQDPFEMAEMRALVDHKPFDLMKHRGVGLIAVAAVSTAGDDDPNGRLVRQHRPDLDRGGMRAQQQRRLVGLRGEVESVVHFAGGMALREIELAEIVVVGLDVGPFSDRKTHIGKNRNQLFGDLGDGMNASDFAR